MSESDTIPFTAPMIPSVIAHYRITAKLGESGMGEVWRAMDTKLGREVAIKILPESFAQDADRTRPFYAGGPCARVAKPPHTAPELSCRLEHNAKRSLFPARHPLRPAPRDRYRELPLTSGPFPTKYREGGPDADANPTRGSDHQREPLFR